MRVDLDAAARRERDAGLVEAEAFDDGPPADADQHDVGLDGLGRAALRRLDGEGDAGVLGSAWSPSMPSWNLMPCLASERCSCLATSSSTPGVMRSRNSITVTSEPSRRHTEPSSRPMMPAPITMRRLGTSVSSSAPVEETIFFSSTATPGSGITSEPVAIRMFLVGSVSLTAPSSPTTATGARRGMRPVAGERR